jgi:hypothetical protein
VVPQRQAPRLVGRGLGCVPFMVMLRRIRTSVNFLQTIVYKGSHEICILDAHGQTMSMCKRTLNLGTLSLPRGILKVEGPGSALTNFHVLSYYAPWLSLSRFRHPLRPILVRPVPPGPRRPGSGTRIEDFTFTHWALTSALEATGSANVFAEDRRRGDSSALQRNK